MNAYQNFLDFFSMTNHERLDGLSEIYFTGMSKEERAMAFEYLLNRVHGGGSRESVNGLFIADPERAAPIVTELLAAQKLHEDAEIAAAWNLGRARPDASLIPVFIRLMSSTDEYNRANAAFYVPADDFTPELESALRGMIRTETETLPLVNAINKYLECHGITRASVSKEEFSHFYRGLRNDKELAFKELEQRQLRAAG